MLSLKSYDSVHVTPSGLRACPLLDDIASEIHIGTAVSILKADRLEAYPTFAMVGCAAKPRSPDVANCRQTVEALLAPLSTAWQQMATIRVPGRFFSSAIPRPTVQTIVKIAIIRKTGNIFSNPPK